MRLRRWGLGAVLAISTLVAAPLATPNSIPAAGAQGPVTLRVAFTTDVDSMNPFQSVLLVPTQILRMMYEYLTVASAKDSSPEPGLAERWETSSDNLTWTFHIRKGMQWSDGQPITARDVAFTYNLIMTNEDAAAANGVAVTNYESVTAKDDTTLVIKTKQPQASMLTSEVPIVPEHVWKDVKDIKNFTNTDKFPVVGSGPFVLTGYQEGQSVTLEANDKFWRGRSKVDKLQYVKYESTDAAVQGLRKGDVELVYRLTANQYKALQNEPNITTHAGNNRRYTEIIFNPGNPKADGSAFGNGNPVLKDVNFRKALAHAVDVKTIIDKVKQGLAEPATQVMPAVYPDWTFKPSESQKHNFDLAKANSLLEAAGYAKGAGGTRTDKQGKEINLRLLVTSDDAERQQIAEFVKGWFAELGVGVTVEFKGSNQVNDDTNAGNYDMAISGWSVSPDPDYQLAQQTCKVVGTELSDSNFCSTEYDALYAKQQGELDKSKRMQLVQQAQAILHDNVSAIMLYYDKQLEAYRSDRFSSFATQPAENGIIANQSGYWGYYNAVPVGAEDTQAASEPNSGLGTGAVVGIVGGAAVLVAGAVWGLSRRRRATADDRE
ncbi:MAG TPA: ABC transporter substrate-binding protein [Actinophytocola sp.]|uniref:ABC transporter substrate-binding protein n=1 Tax=Actinophytocola sp. TaxID=1872138 RepID=UPI002DDD368D|nr:ABC transporter substrate-binding protein [Actinophytocola sp.]HEV2780239.1 ABC transporter substrate-binding protein [Actinophytocola sp.]